MSGPFQQKQIHDLGKSYAMRVVELIYEASTGMVLGYGLAVVFLVGIGLAVSSDLISVPVMHPA